MTKTLTKTSKPAKPASCYKEYARVRDDYFARLKHGPCIQIDGARPVRIQGAESFDLCIHRPTAGRPDQWHITEALTGALLIKGRTRPLAKAALLKEIIRMAKAGDNLESRIQAILTRTGPTPRYAAKD